MRIRMKMDIAGMFHGIPDGVKRGDEVDIDDDNALRYIANGVAEAVSKRDARQADKAAERFDEGVAEAAAEEGVEFVDASAPVERAADARALEPDVVIHDETPAYDPTEAPVPLDDEPVEDEIGVADVADERRNAARTDEPNLVPQLENDKPVKHALDGPLDDPQFADDTDAKALPTTDPDEVDEAIADEEGIVAEGDPKPKTTARARNRERRTRR